MSRKLLLLSATASLMGGAAIAEVPNVAVDVAPVHSLVAQVMKGVGTPSLIVQPGASPHEYSLRPSEASALQEADLVFWMGEGLTPWMEEALETLAGDASVTTFLELNETELLEFREGALFEAHAHDDHDEHGHEEHDHDEHKHDEHGEEEHTHDDHDHDAHAEDKEHGHEDDHAGHDHDDHKDEHDDHAGHDHDADHKEEHDDHAEHDHDEHKDEHDDHAGHDHGHGAEDPHAWLSPTNAAAWLNVIAARLSAADPENASTYFANATEGRAALDAMTARVLAKLEPVRGGSFVVFHDAYQYFELDFGIPASGAISLGDASDPSPARIAEIQGRIQEEGVACVLAEPQFNSGIVATVLDGTEANTGLIDPLGSAIEPGPDLYVTLIEQMADTLVDCL